jgi:hypothetical protein
MKSMMMNTRHSRNHSRKNEETEEKPQVARHVKYKKRLPLDHDMGS